MIRSRRGNDNSMFQQQVTSPIRQRRQFSPSTVHIYLDRSQANFTSGYPTRSACPHSHQRAPQLQQNCPMSLHEPQFRLVLYIRLAQHQPWMPLGWRNLVLAGKSRSHASSRGRPTSSSRSLSTSIRGSPTMSVTSVATPAIMLGGVSAQKHLMSRAPFGCSVPDGCVGTYRGASKSVSRSKYICCDSRGTYLQLTPRQITTEERQVHATLFLTRPPHRRRMRDLNPEPEIAAIQ